MARAVRGKGLVWQVGGRHARGNSCITLITPPYSPYSPLITSNTVGDLLKTAGVQTVRFIRYRADQLS